MLRTAVFCVVFAVIYMIITLTLSEEVGQDTIVQLNFGLIIGALIWIAIKVTDKLD
ncbi:hypothetical protein [Rossellomorea vietnamensis]|uniref:hypothetical protein n=1 Tax=Rossellomorea vietnamensis TaxID=218284 RepID=UPI001653BDCB|nr:hypothetical protein [Rossellomorea vietnamensis]